ncbi:MAG: GGDEF domain-containing protein [Lachnospiraceae bacterium]|nr:GGDEF domain-containing protein [Lachnospiraceae bacterium]
MLYSSFTILAIMLLVVVNFDVLFKNDYSESVEAIRPYRFYLISLLVFYFSDFLWGILYEAQTVALCYADSVFYFLAMVVAIFMWTRFVVLYLHRQDIYGQILKGVGWLLLGTQVVMLIVNVFYPVMFDFAEDATFQPHLFRYLQLYAQVVLYFITSIYSLTIGWKSDESLRHRYRSIGLAGILVSVFLGLQSAVPLIPFSSMGYMLGSSLLHTFVLEDERRAQNAKLRILLDRERRQREELEKARKMAYIDSLTGVRNKYAYFEMEQQIDERITGQSIQQLAVVVFDLNNLKDVNDRLGHEAGDRYIKEGCQLICNTFLHSPVFRVGGDEFVVILEGKDYMNRVGLLRTFDEIMDYNNANGAVVVASGMDEYRPQTDYCYQGVFERADKKMYERKMQLKNSSM